MSSRWAGARPRHPRPPRRLLLSLSFSSGGEGPGLPSPALSLLSQDHLAAPFLLISCAPSSPLLLCN